MMSGIWVCRPFRALFAALLAIVAVLGGAAFGALRATASEIPDAVTDVRIVESGTSLSGSLTMELDWTVPSGTKAGDTFVVQLPPELQAEAGATFDVTGPGGEVVATAMVVGDTVVYTMTAYAEEHEDVTGTAWLNLEWDTTVVDPGSTYDVTFSVGTTTFVDTVTVEPSEPKVTAGKWMNWVNEPPSPHGPDDHLRWGIRTSAFTAEDVGRTVTIVDTAGTAQAIDCASISATILAFDPVAGWEWAAVLPPSSYADSSCTTEEAMISFVVTDALVDHVVRMEGWSTVLDPTLSSYRNEGSVSVDGHTDPVFATAKRLSGGGSGSGHQVVSVGDYVWFDADHDGVQDADEDGIPGVRLILTGPDGAVVKTVQGVQVAPATTDAAGAYLFDSLPVLPAGRHYTVTIDAASVPAGYLSTLAGATEGDRDSSTGSAESSDLVANRATDRTLDFGYWEPVPAIDIEKEDGAGHDADTAADAVELGPTVPAGTGLDFSVTNTGNEALRDVTVSDAVIAGGTVSGLSCTFPDGSSGTTWAGPFEVDASFPCHATLSDVLPGTHEDVASVTGTGVVSGMVVQDEDPYHAKVTVSPKITIVKEDVQGHDANTTPVDLSSSSGATGLAFTVTNSGTEPLVEVVVSDVVVSNGAVTGLTCAFPDGSTGTTWRGPFAVGASFSCTASLSGVLPSDTDHLDTASVTGIGKYTGEKVADDDPYRAVVPAAPAISVVKGDAAGHAADSADTAVELPDGSTSIVITVTNTGNEPLVDVSVSDVVFRGGVVTGLTCNFSAYGGPAMGTSWSGPLPVGAEVPCTAVLRGVQPGAHHKDTVTVKGTGEHSGTVVRDRNPYHAFRSHPQPRTPLPTTGASMGNAGGTGAVLLGLGLGLVAASRRRTRAAGRG
jgi:hypothetical protein